MSNQHQRNTQNHIALHQITRDILAQLPACTDSCRQALRSFSESHNHLRQQFQHRIRTLHSAPVQPLCAIDGTHMVIETAGLTLLLLVVVAVGETELVAQRTCVVPLPPMDDADRLAGDLRTRLELALLAYQVRTDTTTLHVLDGSLITVYLALRRLLRRQVADQQRQRQDWWSGVADLLERRSLAADWNTVLTSRHVAAHSKHVSSNREATAAHVALSTDLYSDAILWSLVLKPDEFTTPIRLPTRNVQVAESFWGFSDEERHAIGAAYQNWRVLYARLRTHGPAMRLETPAQSHSQIMRQLATLSNELTIGEIMEPVPQYLADTLCKGQRQVLHALITGIHNGLRREWDTSLVNLWLGGWRTREKI